MEILLVVGLLLVLSKGGLGSGQQYVNPMAYTQSPNAILGGALNMGGALTTPILSSALNGAGRPLTPGFGLTIGGAQSDPNYGDPGAGQMSLGTDASPGINPGADLSGLDAMPTSYDISGAIDLQPQGFA